MWAGLVSDAVFDEVAGAVAQNDGTAGVELCEDDLAGVLVGHALACFGVDDFDEPHVGVDVETGGRLTVGCGALAPCDLGFGEAVGGHDFDGFGTDLCAEFAELAAHAFGHFFAAEDEFLEIGPACILFGGFLQHVVEEGGHGDDGIGVELGDDADIAVGAHGFAAAGGEGEGVVSQPCVVRLPEGEVRGEGEGVDVAVFRFGAADLHEASTAGFESIEVMLGIQEGDGC